MHESYRESLPLHGVGVEAERSSLENNGSSRGSYDVLTIEGEILSFLILLLGKTFCDYVFFFTSSGNKLISASTFGDQLLNK